jgi:uncharacterized protein (TIGR03437 family)
VAVQHFGALGVWTHSGANPGSRSTYVRFSTGCSYALLSNGEGTDGEGFRSALAESLSAVCLSGRAWPDHDLFFHYFAPRIAPSGVVSAAGFRPGPVAADSLISVFGSDLAGSGEGFSARIRDGSGTEHELPLLYASPAQLNLRVPAGVAPGPATLLVRREPHAVVSAPVEIAGVAPGIFTVDADSRPAAAITRVRADGHQTVETVSSPIRPAGPGEQLWLSLYATGVRGGGAVAVLFDERPVPAGWFGAHSIYHGVDQVNAAIPGGIAGRVRASLVVDGLASNIVLLDFE